MNLSSSSILLYYYLPLLILSIFSINLFLSIAKKKPFTSLTSNPPAVLLRRPPTPPALPFIGHLHLLRPGFSKSLQALSTQYGPLMTIRMASKTSVIVSNAAVAKEILKDNEMNFVSRPDFGASSDYNVFKHSSFVFADYGPYWRFMKKLCMTELLSVPQVARFADIRREEIMTLLETLFRRSEKGEAVDIGKETVKLSNNIICRMAMSTRRSSNSESERVWKFVKEIEELTMKFSLGELLGPLGKLDLFGYGKKLKKLLMEFDGFVEKVIAEHEDMESDDDDDDDDEKKKKKKKKKKKDMVDILLEVGGDENAEIKLSRMDIKAFLLVSNH